jgi:hypothetical protein
MTTYNWDVDILTIEIWIGRIPMYVYVYVYVYVCSAQK